MREALLALLSKEPSHGWELHRRLSVALGGSAPVVNIGQVYVTLGRLERVGLVAVREVEQDSRPDKRVYEATASGREVAAQWLVDVSWRKVAPTDFYLKLLTAAGSGIADPVELIDAQRRELLRMLAGLQREVLSQPANGDAALLAEGAVLRLHADLRWLEACEQRWTTVGRL